MICQNTICDEISVGSSHNQSSSSKRCETMYSLRYGEIWFEFCWVDWLTILFKGNFPHSQYSLT
jgi:hypothetical protein